MKSNILRKSILCGAALLCNQTAIAQQVEETQTPDGELEVIFVTSTKRIQNIQSVPLAVTAVSAQALKDIGVTHILSLDTCRVCNKTT